MDLFNRRIQISEAYRSDPAVKDLVQNFEFASKHPQARVFKNDHASTVAALPVDGRWFVVKIYHPGQWFKALFHFFLKSRGSKTWAAAHYLKSFNIPTVDPVALIEDHLLFFCRQTCFISTFVNGVGAHIYMRSGDIDIKDKQLAAVRIIASLERMHTLGIAHRDTKDENIIIQNDRTYWLDLDSLSRTRLRPALERKQRRDWWLLLYNWCDTPQIQQIFLDEMIRRFGRPFACRIIREMIKKRRKKFTSETSGKNLACLENIEPKISITAPNGRVHGMRGCKDTQRLFANNWGQKRISFTDTSGKKRRLRIHMAESADFAFWEAAAVKFWTGTLGGIKTVPSSAKAKVFSGYIKGHQNRLYFKQFYLRNKRDRLKQRFRKSRARRDLKGIRLAAERGLKVPEARCVIEEPQKTAGALSAIVTAEVKDAVQLHQLLETLRQNRDFRGRRRLMRALGQEMARWHLAGMRHGDARDSNILCRMEGPGKALTETNISFWWLDNERSRPVIRKRELLRNLVQLNMTRSGVSLTDRMRFWQAYWADAGRIYHFRSEKTVLKKVAAKTKKRWIAHGWLAD